MEVKRAGERGDARLGIAADAAECHAFFHLGWLRRVLVCLNADNVALMVMIERWWQQIPRSRPLS